MDTEVKTKSALNDFVVKFANVNGSGSSSANHMFAKAVFRMGIPVSARNIFPSNIQGMPTWYEVRINEKGHLGRRGETVDVMLSVNPQSMPRDVQEVEPGGYFIYDNTKPLDLRLIRSDINYIGIPLTEMTNAEYSEPRLRQLFKNVIYVGALAALIDMDFEVLTKLVSDQFKSKEKLIQPNIHALEMGYRYAKKNFECPISLRLEKRDLIGDKIFVDGNTACGLGAVYGGATVAAWYPITPSTSVAEAFEKYASRLRVDPASGDKNYMVIQAEDELAAMGMVIGAAWNGARSFTATSGPGVSLMNEFLGLGYFAEVPAVLIDVQRAGPSTGMPTKTQQSDVLLAAYASHGDTKHLLLFPASPKECFDLTAQALDVAERIQTPVILLTDLDLGMNDWMSEPFEWDDARRYDRGKVLKAEDLDAMAEAGERFGRYLDKDGDGIPYRTFPGTHPDKGAYFTRGTSRDEYAVYTEDGDKYVENMERLERKFVTALKYLPEPVVTQANGGSKVGVIHYGTTEPSMREAIEILAGEDCHIDDLRLRCFPFHDSVREFINGHEQIFVVEQNRDSQMRTLLVNELEIDPARLIPVTHYDGTPINASKIVESIRVQLVDAEVTPIRSAKK
ncbi:MAG: 2-oxoacid:acceptor oxidoreductase subunit alpha [Porticoccaceae bacterium]